MNNERKYYVKSGMRTNLDSMNTSLELIMYDMEDGKYNTVWIMGKELDIEGVEALRDEVNDLLMKANWGKVTGREYGRIKEISEERDAWRLARNIAAGTPDEYLGYCSMT